MQPISWITETYEHNGKTERRVIREGMSRENVVRTFPPVARKGNALDYNRTALIRAVVLEAYEDGDSRKEGNVRTFWYIRLMWTLINTLGESGTDENMNSIDVTISNVFKALVEDDGLIDLYDVLGLQSEKRRFYHVSVREDSPYPRTVVFVEKESLFNDLKDIADTFEISFVAAGGQNSREAALNYAKQLEELGIDLYEDFTVFSVADFDPEGWKIPEGFVDHLSAAVKGNVELIRLGVLREHLGESAIRFGAVPYPTKAKNKNARKGQLTKYANFSAESGGGIYRDGTPMRVELNVYTNEQLRERIITELERRLSAFPFQTRALSNEIRSVYDDAIEAVRDGVRDDVSDVYQPFYDEINETQESIDDERETRAPEERARIKELEAELERLRSIVNEKCSDLDRKSEALENLKSKLEEDEGEAVNKIMDDWLNSDIDGADDLINSIMNWREWMEGLGIDEIGSSYLGYDARAHRTFSYRVDGADSKSIRDWIVDEIGTTDEAGELGVDPSNLVAETLLGL